MDITDTLARGGAFIIVVYLLWALVGVIRRVWRWGKDRSRTAVTDVAHGAGKLTAKVERHASSAAEAFRQGRRD